jgi:cyclophilin family peptidyl-prolyl cis-trans isomerase
VPLAARAEEGGLPDGLYAEITTPKGVITCELEYARAPLTVASFVGLAEGTLGPAPRRPFFDGLKFHRVVPNFVIQGGDPLGTGDGGPGYTFPDELSAGLGYNDAGVLSMANDGPDTNGSQFFITLAPVERLNFLYSVFGHAVRGSDVPARITQGDVMRVRILRLGPAAQAFKADDAAFGALSAKARRYTAEKDPGPKAHFDDPDKLLPADPPRAQYFNYKLANVERMTGRKVYARVLAKFLPASPGDTPDAFTARLAQSLGLDEDGVLAVYFADTGKWSLSIGKSMVPRFTEMTGSTQNVASRDALADGIRKFFTACRAREAKYSAQSQAALANFLQIPAQRIKVAVDAVVDELVDKTVI